MSAPDAFALDDRPGHLRLAEAVAARGRALLVDADNRSAGWVPLADVGSRPYAVAPTADVLAVDLDLDGPDPAAAAAAFDALTEALHAVGARPVTAASGRPGHRHLFCRLGPPDPARRALEAWCRGAGLDVRSQAIRPPLAPHRLGLRPRLLTPATTAGALDVPAVPAPSGVAAAVAARVGAPVLSARMRRLMRSGPLGSGYRSASEGRMAVAVAARAVGFSPRWMAAALDDPANALGHSWRSRPDIWRRAEIERLWSKAGAWLAAPRPTGTVGEGQLGSWRAALDGAAWPGMSGGTDLAVAEGLAGLVRPSALTRSPGTPLQVTAALSQAALAAGVSLSTARRSLRRLAAAGWLQVAEAPSATTATVYRLTVPAGTPAGADPGPGLPPHRDGLVAPGLNLGADVARWGALGKSAARVLRALTGPAVTAGQLAGLLHSSRGAVAALLRRLESFGLAARQGKGWTATGADLDTLAERLGTAGAHAADEARYAEQREQRRRSRAAWAAAFAEVHAAGASTSGGRGAPPDGERSPVGGSGPATLRRLGTGFR